MPRTNRLAGDARRLLASSGRQTIGTSEWHTHGTQLAPSYLQHTEDWAREEACGCNESRLQLWEQDAGHRFTVGVDANDEPMSWTRRTPLGPWKPAAVVIVG